MRLSRSDRRKLDIILRTRYVQVKKINLSSSLLVALTLTIWLSPLAYAQVTEKPVHLRMEKTYMLEQDDDNVRVYTKQELAKRIPDAAETVGERLGDEVIGIIKSLGESRSSADKIRKHRSEAQSKKQYFERASVGLSYNEHDSEADPDKIREQISKESANVIARENFQNTVLWKRLKKGLDFKLDIASFFGPQRTQPQPKKTKGQIRYGLIVKEIRPDNSLEKARAAVDATLMEEEMQYAGKAQIEWTIGPLTEKPRSKKRVFATRQRLANGQVVSEEDLQALKEYQAELNEGELPDPIDIIDEANTDASVWATGIKPGLSGNIKPAGKDAGESLAASKMPGLRITLTQEQGLYEYMTQTAGPGAAEKSEHRFKVPIFGTMSVGRRYSDKMDVISTSAHNILMTKRLPSISVHYYEQKEQIVADARHEHDGYTLTATARTDAEGVTKTEKSKRKNQRGYELGLSKRF